MEKSRAFEAFRFVFSIVVIIGCMLALSLYYCGNTEKYCIYNTYNVPNILNILVIPIGITFFAAARLAIIYWKRLTAKQLIKSSLVVVFLVLIAYGFATTPEPRL